MKKNALNWFEIFTADIEKAVVFYTEILATTLTPSYTEAYKMAMFPSDMENGVGGGLTQMEGCLPGSGGTLVYLNAEGELDAILSRVSAAGGTVIRDRFEIAPHGFIGLFKDPEGNLVGLHSMV